MEYIPGLAGVPATKSKISDIDGELGKLYYRGYAVEELTEKSSFEEVAYLLLNGELPKETDLEAFKEKMRKHRKIKINIEKILKYLPADSSPMQVLQVGACALSSFFPSTHIELEKVYTPEDQLDAATTILSHIGTLVAIWEHIRHGHSPVAPNLNLDSYAENFLYMIHDKEPDPQSVKILDACLVLHAEHTINASTFTSMVTSSTLANPCSSIAAGIASLSGPLHGGANLAVVKMIDEIGSIDKVEQYIDDRLKNKQVIWGMGHREYKTKDPRAVILEKMMEELIATEGKGSEKLEIAKKVETVCEDRLSDKGVYPNVDFYSGILYQEMGLRPALYTPLFAMSRTAGWLAHIMEQLDGNRIFRPTQIYTGYSPRSYQPMSERS